MTFTEFLEILDQAKILLAQHNIGRDEVMVKIYGERGDPHQMILKQEGDNSAVNITIRLQ